MTRFSTLRESDYGSHHFPLSSTQMLLRTPSLFSTLACFAFLASPAATAQEQGDTAEQLVADKDEEEEKEKEKAVAAAATKQLAAAEQLFANLDFDRVIPLTKEVLALGGVPRKQKLQAYLLQGMALAIVGDPIEAETPFRLLLREDIEFDLPKDTPPKILQAWRKVQAEEREIFAEQERLKLERIMGTLAIRGEDPLGAVGGRPLRFNYIIKDETGVVDVLRVRYRKMGEQDFSSLALKRDANGSWVGAVPGAWTANEDGLVVEFMLEAEGLGERVLKRKGAPEKPLQLSVTPGSTELASPPPIPLWVFMMTATAGGGVVLTTATLAGFAIYAQLDYYATVGRFPFPENTAATVDGGLLKRKAFLGQSLLTSFYVGLGLTAVSLVTIGGLALFTNFSGEEEEPAY